MPPLVTPLTMEPMKAVRTVLNARAWGDRSQESESMFESGKGCGSANIGYYFRLLESEQKDCAEKKERDMDEVEEDNKET